MTKKALRALPLLMLIVAASAVAEGPVRVGYHEAAVGFRNVDASPAGDPGDTAKGSRRRLEFSAFGRQFDVELERNDRLYSGWKASPLPVAGKAQAYRGNLRDLPGSWARLTVIDGVPVGAIWDGSELFLVDSPERFGITPEPGASNVTVVRASDVRIPIDAMHYAAQSPATSDAAQADLSALSFVSAAVGPGSLVGAIPVGLVLDTSFVDDFSDPMGYAMAVANVVDGIFVAQLGLHIDVEQVEVYAFTSTNAETLLDQLGKLKKSTPGLRQLGLLHLLTRSALDNDYVGMATVGRVCQDGQGVGVTRASGGITSALVMAHELGHNFGAAHDGEAGSACAATPANYLMSATLNYARQFSACSIDSMTPVINAASCIAAIKTSDVRLIGPAPAGPAWYGQSLRLDYTVYNGGTESTLENLVTFSSNNPEALVINSIENQNCVSITSSPDQATCDLQSIHAGQAYPVSLRVTPRTTEMLRVDAAVSAANDVDTSNNSASLQIEVLPATDLLANADHGGGLAYAQPGWIVPVSATVVNAGDFETRATMNISTETSHRLLAPPGCVQDEPSRMHCEFGMLAAHERRSLPFELQIDSKLALGITEVRQAHVYVQAVSSLHDINAGNDWTTLPVNLVGSIHDLDLSFMSAPEGLVAGEARTFSIRVRNLGPDAAADLYIVTNGDGLDFSDWTLDRGTCTTDGPWLNCSIDRLDVGEEIDLAVTYTSNTPDTYSISSQAYASGGVDTVLDNGWQQVDIVVSSNTPPQVAAQTQNAGGASSNGGGDSGGGGGISWLELLVSLMALAWTTLRTGRQLPRPISDTCRNGAAVVCMRVSRSPAHVSGHACCRDTP